MICTSFVSAALTDNLISYYKLDESSGAVLDAHGTDDGVNARATPNVGGKINTAYEWDAQNEMINVSASANNADIFDGGGSVSVWISPGSQGSGNIYGRFLDKAEGPADNNGYGIHAGQNKITFVHGFGTARGGWYTNTNVITYGSNWYHVVVLFDSSSASNNPLIYVDGSNEALTEFLVPSGSQISDSAYDLLIGTTIAGDYTFDGEIDEIGIWDRTLNASEISQLYNNSDGLAYPFGPVDTCTYGGSGNWAVDCSDNCTISSNVVGDLSNLTIIGTGYFLLNANISDFILYYFQGACTVTCRTGCFKG